MDEWIYVIYYMRVSVQCTKHGLDRNGYSHDMSVSRPHHKDDLIEA